jgi:hypothetical protein
MISAWMAVTMTKDHVQRELGKYIFLVVARGAVE